MKRHFGSSLLMMLFSIFLIELGSWGLATLITDGLTQTKEERWKTYNRGHTIEEARNANTPAQIERALGDQPGGQLHPYFGYAGFTSDDIMNFVSKDNYNVVLIGGSVSGQVYANLAEKIRDDLKKARAHTSTDADAGPVNLFLFAAGGYKQPQQLAVISYLIAIGAKIDLVINIDGYSELAIAWFNYKDNVDISWPYNWRYRTALFDDRSRLIISKGVVWADWKSRWARVMDKPYIGWSPTATLVWKLGDQWMENRLDALRAIIADQETSTQHSPLGYKNSDSLGETLRRSEQIWFNSNEAIAVLLANRNIPYVHILQPNQYVRASKIFTENEKKIAFSNTSTVFSSNPALSKYVSDELNDLVIPEGYEELRRLGKSASPNEHFIDGTMLFSSVKEDIYIDDCCHVNRLGTEIIWAEILRSIELDNDIFH